MDKKLTHSREIIDQLLPVINSDKKITVDEMDELYQLFMLFDYGPEDRLNVLNTLLNADRLDLDRIEPSSLSLNEKLILAKSLIKFRDMQTGPVAGALGFIENKLQDLKLPPKVISTLREIADKERAVMQALRENGNLQLLASKIEDTAVKGFSLGVPLSVLYLFGIKGLGATGITSGLSVIGGFAGLGFSPMVGGLIVLFSVAIAANRVIENKIIPFIKKEGPGLLQKLLIRKQALNALCEKIADGLNEDINALKASSAFGRNFFKKRRLSRTLERLKQEYERRKKQILEAEITETPLLPAKRRKP